MPVWPIRGGGYEVMEAARCGEAKGVSRPSGTDVWIDGVRYLGTVGEATGIASSAGYRVSCRAKGRPQQRRRVQPVGGSASAGTQVTAAAISLNQICQAATERDGERKPVRSRLAERVQSRRALLHALYPVGGAS